LAEDPVVLKRKKIALYMPVGVYFMVGRADPRENKGGRAGQSYRCPGNSGKTYCESLEFPFIIKIKMRKL